MRRSGSGRGLGNTAVVTSASMRARGACGASGSSLGAVALAGLVVLGVAATFGGCALQNAGLGAPAKGSDGGASGDAAADAGIAGAGCAPEAETSANLCAATSQCPNVVVDTQAFPHCGYRIRGASVDLVCACGTSICPMGVFANCQEAAKLLTSQTESIVCTQVAEGRCTESTSSSTSGSSGARGTPGCDRDCVSQCGGGAGCASACGC